MSTINENKSWVTILRIKSKTEEIWKGDFDIIQKYMIIFTKYQNYAQRQNWPFKYDFGKCFSSNNNFRCQKMKNMTKYYNIFISHESIKEIQIFSASIICFYSVK